MKLLPIVLPIVVGILVLAFVLAAWRMVRGPSSLDRLLALDTLYIVSLGFLVVWGIWQNSMLYFEVALLIGLLGFFGTVVIATYLLRGRIVP
jgi:multicomponent K+:H+ antiporter subunit F